MWVGGIFLWVEHNKKVSWNIHHKQFAKLLWPMHDNTDLGLPELPLSTTYITSIINSLMIYGNFILFYSLSCPTAHYPAFLHSRAHSKRKAEIFNKIIFGQLFSTPQLWCIFQFFHLCCVIEWFFFYSRALLNWEEIFFFWLPFTIFRMCRGIELLKISI